MRKPLLFLIAFLAFVACYEDEEEVVLVATDPISLNVGGEYQIPVNTEITSTETDSYFVADIDETAKVKAYHVGETVVRINRRYEIEVTVNGKYSLYPDPYLDWGATRKSIKKKETRATFKYDEDDYLAYWDFGSANVLMYFFDDNDKLVEVGVTVNQNYKNTLLNHLNERFYGFSYDPFDFIGFDNYEEDEVKTFVSAELYYPSSNSEPPYYMIFYDNYSMLKSTSLKDVYVKVDQQKIKKLEACAEEYSSYID